MSIDSIANGDDSILAISIKEKLEKVLSVEQLDQRLSFYDHGGDSLTFVIFISELFNQLEHSITDIRISGIQPLSELISSITNACLKKSEQGILEGKQLLSQPKKNEDSDKNYFPITANRYSYLSKMIDGIDSWVVHSPVYKVLDFIGKDFLKETYASVALKFDGLRLKVSYSEGKYFQELASQNTIVINVTIGEELIKTEIDELIRNKIDEVRRSISLENNMVLLLLNDTVMNESYIVLIFHHVLLDSVSLREVEKELFNSLSQRSVYFEGEEEEATSYRDYCVEYYHRCERLSREAASYWNRFPWPSIAPIPLDFEEERAQLSNEWTKERKIYFGGDEFDIAVKKLAKHSNMSVSPIIIASLSKAYGIWSNQSHFLLELAHHGRAIDLKMTNFAKTVGWINETVPIILPTSSSLDTVKETKEQLLRMDKEASLYNYCRYMSKNASISEQFQQYPNSDISLNIELSFSELKNLPSNVTPYPLNVLPGIGQRVHQISGGAVRKNDYFYISLDYNSKAFKESSIETFLNLWSEEFTKILFELSGINLTKKNSKYRV